MRKRPTAKMVMLFAIMAACYLTAGCKTTSAVKLEVRIEHFAVREFKFDGHHLCLTGTNDETACVDVRSVETKVDSTAYGTYAVVKYVNNERCGSFIQCFDPSKAVLEVTSPADKATWDNTLANIRKEFFEPRNVVPKTP